jgi:hypothetical protein
VRPNKRALQTRPMPRILASVTSLAQHLRAVRRNPDSYRPDVCPHCGLRRLWHHGRYFRKADRCPPRRRHRPIPVLRFLCPECRGTCSRLPACIPPLRWYLWAVQQVVLLALVLGGTLSAAVQAVSGPGRRTVGRWRHWLLGDAGDGFAMHLRSRWSELGRFPDRPTFWHHLLEARGLVAVMSWLDSQDLPVP